MAREKPRRPCGSSRVDLVQAFREAGGFVISSCQRRSLKHGTATCMYELELTECAAFRRNRPNTVDSTKILERAV